MKINYPISNWLNRGKDIFPLFLLCLYSCDPPGDRRLVYVNESDKYLLYHIDPHDALPQESPFSDIRKYYKDPIGKDSSDVHSYFRLIKPYEKKVMSTGTGLWDGRFLRSPNGRLHLYVMDFDLVERVPWDSIRENKLYKAKYTLTLDSLQKVGWLVKGQK